MNLRDLITTQSEKLKDKVWLINASDGREWTYTDLDKVTNKIGNIITSLGIQKGNKVSILLPNIPEFVFLYLGIPKTGAVVGPVNALFKGREISFVVNHAESKILVTIPKFMPIIKEIRDELVNIEKILLIGAEEDVKKWITQDTLNFYKLFEEASEDPTPDPGIDDDDEAAILYTSGTTGFPKGVLQTHKNIFDVILEAYPNVSSNGCRTILQAIKKAAPDLIINISTAISPFVTVKERIAPVIALEPEMCSLNTNSMNFAVGDWKKGKVINEIVFENTFKTIRKFAKKINKAGTKPELEVYDFGGMYNVQFLRKANLIPEPMHLQYVFGVLGGVPFSPMNLAHLLDLKPENWTWSVCGVAKNQFLAGICSAAIGGHIRVGLEDNIKDINGNLCKGSWEQIKWAADVAKLAGRTIMTPDEVRELLKLKGTDNVNF